MKSVAILKGSRDLVLEFWDPLHILGTVEARNLKFGTQIDYKIKSMGVVRGHVTYF